MGDPAPAIRARGLSKTFGRGRRATRALDDVSLEVPRGSIAGLVGPNGAGKSTLMLALLGLVRPDAGRAELYGVDAREPRARAGVGYLPEEAAFEAGLTVADVLRLHRRLAAPGWANRGAPEGRDLVPARSKRVGRCSMGTARRLALACALLDRPRLLLLDEPTSGLDPAARDALLERLRRHARSGGSALVSSHVLAELASVCDRWMLIDGGRIVAEGRDRLAERAGRLLAGIARGRLDAEAPGER